MLQDGVREKDVLQDAYAPGELDQLRKLRAAARDATSKGMARVNCAIYQAAIRRFRAPKLELGALRFFAKELVWKVVRFGAGQPRSWTTEKPRPLYSF